MQTCFLVGAAPGAARIAPKPGDIVIAADGGCDHLLQWGIAPDFIVGDMDSISTLPEDIPCLKAPAEKDETDLALAFWEGYSRGMRRFVLTGASGGRMDHSVANLQLLVKAAKLGVYAVMQDEAYGVTALAGPESLKLGGRGVVSVFAYGEEAAGVTIQGMKYNIMNETLKGDTPRGVSNELDGEGVIAAERGVLLIFWETGIEYKL
jgi:thiamine pyrophosphokinase